MNYTKDEILHAIELRKEQSELRKEHELLVAEKHTAIGGKKAGLTRKLKKVYTRLLELNAALCDAPPSPLEPNEAIVAIGDVIQLILGTYDSAKATFMEHCAENPDYAVKYCLKNMMIAGAQVDFLRYISKVLKSEPANPDGLVVLKKTVGDTKDRIMNEYVLNVNSLSTSKESNLLDEYKREAAVQLMQKRMAFTSIFDQMDSIFAGVEVWQILSELE